MRIREVQDKTVGETVYKRFLITLPKKVVQESKLFGKELEAKAEKNRIVIESQKWAQ